MAHETPRHWDHSMRRRLQEGETAALAELYDRFASLAHGIAQRVLDDDEAVARVVTEVFARAWQAPGEFDADEGPLRSWIAAEAHRQAVRQVRLEHGGAPPEELAGKLRAASTAARADYIVTAMPAPLREALALARFQRLDLRQLAGRLGITEPEAARRLRLGLQLLSSAARYPVEEEGTAA
ncbi:sigma-70 family RNA polymerase sigma factor [Streptomyces sodiiphilus]|uniref:Sigma-70 family RNA polymerase sigma factor n=1 Tax=Streptomyces sodiiphilus TaxID=226217 RepID=A0ABN2P4S8_9ACTN